MVGTDSLGLSGQKKRFQPLMPKRLNHDATDCNVLRIRCQPSPASCQTSQTSSLTAYFQPTSLQGRGLSIQNLSSTYNAFAISTGQT
jgi:hypothetical protein